MSFPEDSRIKYDDRVRFVDKKGLCHYGNARWYGRRTRQKSWDDSLKIGILTDNAVLSEDFDDSECGMNHLLLQPHGKARALFIPESSISPCSLEKKQTIKQDEQSSDTSEPECKAKATQMEATVRAILLKDVQGAKVDSGPKSAIKKFIGSATRSPANVLSGELLLGHVNDDHYNYVLSRDSSVFMFCDVNDTASLNHDEFLLLEAIERPCDRLTAFRRLEWGVSLTVDSAVSVTLPEEISINKRVSATVQYKGTIGKLPGIHFGVEILHRNSPIGTTDGTFRGIRYFSCQDKCGLFVPLHLVHPIEEVPPQSTECTVSLQSDQRSKPTYTATKDNSPQPSHIGKESAVDLAPSIFKIGERVAFYSTKGVKNYGVVGWTGRETKSRKFPYVIVGIVTDEQILYLNEFEESVTGITHLLPSAPLRQTLFIPEALVEKVRKSCGNVEEQRQVSKYTYEEKHSSSSQDQRVHRGEQLPRVEERREVKSQNEVLAHHTRNKPEQSYKSRNSSQTESALSQQSQQQKREKYGGDNNAEVPRRVETCTILYDGEEILLPTKPNASSGAMVDLNGMDFFQENSIALNLQSSGKRCYDSTNYVQPLYDKPLTKKRIAELNKQIEDLKKAEQIKSRSKETIREIKTLLDSSSMLDHESEIEKKSKQLADLQEELLEIHLSIASSNLSRTELKFEQRIGNGAWGEVWSGTIRGSGDLVAIKIVHRHLLCPTTMDMLKREVKIMASIQHPNLVEFKGAMINDVVEGGIDLPIIVSELMDMNLRDAYNKVNLSPFLVSIFCDVANAIHYLHQHSQPIIHRDVSAPNVLLKSLQSGGYQAKVSDFGSANLVKQSKTPGTGAIAYSAPEMFPQEGIAAPPPPQTTKVDVFSYGVLMMEVIVKEMPTVENRHTMLERVGSTWEQMYELISLCTKIQPFERPTMAEILNKLEKIPHQI